MQLAEPHNAPRPNASPAFIQRKITSRRPLNAKMPPRRKKKKTAAKKPPVSKKDVCPTKMVKNKKNKLVSKRIWTEKVKSYKDKVAFSGPAPGYIGSGNSDSKEIDFFLELFDEAARFILIATNRFIRRQRNKLEMQVSDIEIVKSQY